MKKVSSIISAIALAVSVLGAVPVIAGAEETESLVYGTMNIPYADFYRERSTKQMRTEQEQFSELLILSQ
ncbi:MAG: hypothetical protein K2H26_01645 [Ruminococcus sp.]|nr:hypothetical protein [Ruminococcus sp.]